VLKLPAEIFGRPIEQKPDKPTKVKRRYWCPFVNQKCNKQSRLIKFPMGVCSVKYGEQIIALCPRRFLQDNIVFKNIADHYFNTRHDLLVFSEVGLPNVGTFDYVMVKHKPFSSEIEDFVIIEFQTGQTTNTGNLVKALKDFMRGEDINGKTYNFGLNLADIWKRSFTQVLNKGIILEHWGNKIYWVIQELVYRNLLDRYNLHGMGFKQSHKTIFYTHDLLMKVNEYTLSPIRVESSTTDNLFKAFRNNPNIPSKGDFICKLENKLRAKMELKLQLD